MSDNVDLSGALNLSDGASNAEITSAIRALAQAKVSAITPHLANGSPQPASTPAGRSDLGTITNPHGDIYATGLNVGGETLDFGVLNSLSQGNIFIFSTTGNHTVTWNFDAPCYAIVYSGQAGSQGGQGGGGGKGSPQTSAAGNGGVGTNGGDGGSSQVSKTGANAFLARAGSSIGPPYFRSADNDKNYFARRQVAGIATNVEILNSQLIADFRFSRGGDGGGGGTSDSEGGNRAFFDGNGFLVDYKIGRQGAGFNSNLSAGGGGFDGGATSPTGGNGGDVGHPKGFICKVEFLIPSSLLGYGSTFDVTVGDGGLGGLPGSGGTGNNGANGQDGEGGQAGRTGCVILMPVLSQS